MAKKIPDKLIQIIKDCGLTIQESIWDCHGTHVIYHSALEKIAAHKKITFDDPHVIHSDPKEKICVMKVSGKMNDRLEWSIGEAAPYNNKNSYPYAMSEKRAKDRVILKLIDVAGDVYSSEEADWEEEKRKKDKENPNVKPAAIPEKKKVEPVEQKSTAYSEKYPILPNFEDWHPGQHEKVQGLYSLKDIQNWKETDGKIAKHFYHHGNDNQKLLCISLMRWLKKQENSAKEQGRDI